MNLEDSRDADMICFMPTAESLIRCRSAFRTVLIDALRRDIPISAIIENLGSFLLPEQYDSLCEMLTYDSFIFTDSRSAEIFLKEKEDDYDDEEILRAIHKRFGVTSVILTDASLAFDGEKITPFEGE
jgi:hypothetical protein